MKAVRSVSKIRGFKRRGMRGLNLIYLVYFCVIFSTSVDYKRLKVVFKSQKGREAILEGALFQKGVGNTPCVLWRVDLLRGISRGELNLTYVIYSP